MAPNIAALSRMQIERFFHQNNSSVTATPSQGGSSYTVEGGNVVVQFRVPHSTLDMDLLQSIEQTYQGFVPHHEYQGQLGQLSVYTMNNIGGACMYLARDELLSNDSYLLRVTLDDYARFFVSAFYNTPTMMARPDPAQLLTKYLSQLGQLRSELPQRFHPTLDDLIPQVSDLFAEGWPLVPNHTDLLENNIHVDPATGSITGICDWREAEVSPFGMSLGGLEVMLGVPVTGRSSWRYHPNHEELRDYFWTRFYHYLGDASNEQKRRIQTARLVGLFLAYAFEYGRPATEESENLRILGALILE
ncbi:hypothetical protein QBC44DRAFT_363917 [Cladorrhinum sp. PSN332]|nr:hypothetical protein QBC44DRAFT_363917 [Cladorrhinum sp. PSN332]